MVVVVDGDQPAQALVAGQGGGLVADALGQVAVTTHYEGSMVTEVGTESGSQVALGDSHAHRVGEALAEGAGGDLDTGGAADLGMAGGGRAPLAEVAEVIQRQAVSG